MNQDSSMVDRPPHYTAGKIECIDALESATIGLIGIDAVCTAAAIKYLWRWKSKGGTEDLEKARWYINRLLNSVMIALPLHGETSEPARSSTLRASKTQANGDTA